MAFKRKALALIILALAAALMLGRVLYICAGGDPKIVSFIPDDGFYYVVLAKNFATFARWTFDGTAPATGFHPMFAYLLAGAYKLWPTVSLAELFVLTSTIFVAIVIGAASLTAAALRGRCSLVAVVIALSITAGSAASLTTIMMESCLPLLFSACLLYLVFAPNQNWSTRTCTIFAVIVGALGSLARTDFGWLTIATLAGALVTVEESSRRHALRIAIASFGGALIGLALVTWQVHAISGEWIQASALVKQHWSAINGPDFVTPLRVLLSVAVPGLNAPVHIIPLKSAAVAISGLTEGYLVLRIWRERGITVFQDPLLIYGVTAVAGYTIIYSFDGAVQAWYAANLIVPITAVLCVLISALRMRGSVALITAAALLVIGLLPTFLPSYAWQLYPMQAGRYLYTHPQLKPAGSWNSGVVAYFSRGGVVNLDGLVNDQIYPYVIHGDISHYVVSRHLRTIVEYARWAVQYPGRCNYGEGVLHGMNLVHSFDDPRVPDKIWPRALRAIAPDYSKRDVYDVCRTRPSTG